MIAHNVTGADYEALEAAATTVRAVNEHSSQTRPGIAIADASAREDHGTMSFEVTLGARNSEEVTVRYRTEEGTAEGGEDYTSASGALTFAPGDLSRTIQVTLLDDSSDEETEGFQVTLSDAVNAGIGDATANGEIEDDDGPPTVTVAGGTAAEADESLRFTLTLSTPSSFEVTVPYETVEVPEDQGGATEGRDFTAKADSLTIAPGTKYADIDVPLIDDTLDERDETVGLALSTPTNAFLAPDQASGAGVILDDDDPPTLSVTGGTAAEAAGSIAFNFELSAASSLPVVAPYRTLDDTATAGADYESSSGSLTIAAGQTQGVVHVPLYRDVLVEPDETFGLLVDTEAVQDAAYSGNISDPVGTILDSPGPGLEVGDAVATEASGTIAFPVRILGAASSAVTVDWTTRDGAAVAGSDYTAANGTLTIAAGTGEADIAVVLIEDRTVEDDETFSVVLSNASGAALIDSMGVGTITEDPLPVVSVAAASATESAAALSFGVSVNQAAAREIRVSYQTSDVTATQDEDYLVTSGVLTFAPGDRRKEIAVPIVGDGFDESDETLLLTLSGVRNATLGANPATGTIRDDDEAPIVSVTDAQGTEGGVLTFEVSLSAASRRGVTVGYATVAGAATAGDDYTAAEGTLTFDPDVTTRQVRVALEQDSTHEPTETFTVELRSPVNAAVSQTDGSATGAILDDDVRAVVVAPLRISVREGGENSYTVRLATRPVSAVTVEIAVTGSAGVSTDLSSLTFTTADWATAQTVGVSAAVDQNRESETARVDHTASGGGYGDVAADSVTVRVSDGDAASTSIALSVDPRSVSENGGIRTVEVKGVLNGATLTELTVVAVTVQGGTATVTNDFLSVPSFSLTIPADSLEGTATFSFAPVDDDVDEEESETVSVSGTTTADGLTVRATEMAIVDDDERGVVVRPTVLTVAENSTGEYTVALESEPTGPVMVGLTKSGSAGVTVAGTSLTFTDSTWATAQTVTVTASDDVDSANERATVAHTVTGADYSGEPADSVEITVADDERVAGTIALSAAPDAVGEDAGATLVRVTAVLDGAPRNQATAVDVQVGDPADGAVEGTDYQAVNNFTLTIVAGAVSGTATFTLTPLGDQVAEGDETISVRGTITVQGLTVTGTTVTLEDGDVPPETIVLSVDPGLVSEGDSATTVTVTATFDGVARAGPTELTGSVGAESDSATETSDYQAVAGFRLTIPAGMRSGTGTFTLTPIDDTLGEGDERISVSGSASGFHVTGTGVTLSDNETVSTGVTLRAAPASIGEDDVATSVNVTATLDDAVRPEATTVTVSVGTRQDGATEGIDYGTVPSFEVTILGGSRLGTAPFRLAPADDSTYEGSESISVKGAASPALAVTGTRLALIDDEEESDIVTLSVSPSEVAEGAGETPVAVMAALNGAARSDDTPVRIDVGASDDDAREGEDYTTVDQFTITILAGTLSNTETFLLTPTQDLVDEPAETLSVSGTTSATGLSVNGTEVTITDDDTAGVTVSPTSLTIMEGASDAYTVVLDSQPTADVMVTLSVPGSSGFTADPSVLTFSSTTWDTAQTVTVSATEDADAVAPAPATIGHSAAGGGYDAVTVEGVVVTVTEDDAAGVTVTPTSLTIMEGASDAYTVVLTTQPPADVMVTLSVPGSSGFTADPSVLTFSSTTWDTAQTVTVSATEDADAVAPAPATIGHSAAGGGYDAVTVEGVVVTVTEDDAAGVTVSPTSLTIMEGASDAYTVVLTTPPPADVMVTLSVPGAGGFTADPSVLTFSSTTWDTAQTVTVSATEDADAVARAPATIGHSAAGGGYDAVTVEGVVVTVTEDDTAGVTVTPTSLTITEGASDTYTVVLTTQPPAGVMVTLSVPGSSGFTADPSVLTFSSTTWDTAQTVTVSATEDADAVARAPATIGHSAAGGGYDAVTVEGVLVTVTEDDAAGVTVSPTSLTITEGASDAYTVVLTTPPPADVMVTLSVPGAGGFTADPAVLTFSSTTWSTAQTVTVSATEDADAVAPAPATIGHSAAGGGYDAVTVEGVVVTVTENDAAVQTDTVTLSATPTEVGEGAVATPVLVTVTLQGAVRSTATPVRIGVGLSGDGATEGVDYATVDEFTITIAAEAASNTGTFTLTPTQDTLDEADETLSVTGTTSVAGLSVTPTEVTIEDDDTGLPSVAFASNAYVVEEGKAVVVGVLLSRQRQTETVVLLTVDSALDGGGVDYTGVPEMVAFAPGQTLAEFAFRAEPDDVSDSGEVVVLALGDLPPDLDRGSPDMTRIEIVEHSTLAVALPSPPALPELTIAPGPSPVTEGSEVEFTVTRSHALTELPAVEVLVSETGSVLGPDPPAEVRFSPGELAAVLSLPTVDDNLDEPTSVVRAALSAGDGYALGGETTATVRVADNDAEPELTIEPLIVGEGERVAEFVARLSAGSARPLTVDWSTSDGEAFAGSDYRVTSGVMTFAAGEREARLKVELIDDDVAEPSEEFTIVLRDAQMIAEQRSTKATIIDDDAAPTAITLALDRERVSEGAGATTVTVTASLIGGVWDRATLVEVAVAGGGDEEAVDFSPVSGFEILIPATESSAAASFTLIPEDDRIDERNEAVEVSGTSTLPVTAASLILEDDDASSRSIRLTVDRERVSEGAGPAVITVTATLDRSARTEDTPVQIVLSDSGLAEAVDYSAVREFGLTIPTGQLSGSVQFTLIPEDDRIDERDETIEVAGSSVLPVSPALVLLEDDDGASQAIVLSLDQEVILENAGPTLVTVTAALDRSARTEDTPVRIEVRGSGTPGAVRFAPVDSFDLTIGAGELSGAGTFTMTPLISILKSSPETVGVRGASDLPVVPAALLLVDVDTGEVPAGWLERFARTVASQTVDLVRERLDGMVGGGNQLTLFGYRLFGGYGGQLGGPYGGPAFSGYGLSGSAGPAGQVRAGPLPVGAASAGGGWLGGQGPFGYSGHGGGVSLMGGQIGGGSLGGAVALSSSLGQLATWGDRAPAFSLSRYPSDQRRDLLARSSFTFSSAGGSGDGAEDAGNWMVWGRGAKTNFRGREANASLIGDVVTGTVGVDYERGDVLAGVAIARTSGQGRMEATGAVADVDASLTSGLPYLRVKVGDRLTLWGILGYGQGRYRVTEHDFVTETDIGVAMAAAGARRDLASWASGLRLRLNSDAFLTRVQSEAVPGLDAVDADVNRLRFALEGSYARSFASGSVLTPSVELGVRYDGGAADTGYGVELGASLRYANIDRGLTAEVAARSLLTHEASDFEEWGASGSMALDPGQSGLGPAFRIRSSWGAASGGVQQLWSQEQMFEHPTRSSFQQGGRMEAEAGYGFGRRLGRNRLMPYGVLMGTQQGERGFGMGARLNLGAAFNLTMEASRRERSGPATVDASTSDDAVVIRGVWRLPPRRQPPRRQPPRRQPLPGFADDPATASFSPCPVEEQVSEAWAPATDLPADGGAALPDSSGPGAACADGR